MMGLDIWFSEDIRNALLAANESSAATAAEIVAILPIKRIVDPDEGDDGLIVSLRAYRRGYRAALATLALAFGLSLASIELHEIEEPR